MKRSSFKIDCKWIFLLYFSIFLLKEYKPNYFRKQYLWLNLNTVQFFIQNVFKLIQDSLVTSATNAQTVLLLFQQK